MMTECYFRGSLFLKKGLPGTTESLTEGLKQLGAYAEKNGFQELARKIRMKQFVFLYLEDRAQELEGAPEYASDLIRSFEDRPDETARLADCYIRIPMLGQVESLNAGVASALLMYEAARQRRV